MLSETQDQLPRVWLLTGKRAGDRAQILNLAEALGWPFEEKRLVHNRLGALPNVCMGESRLNLDQDSVRALTPPWPDLVIASGRPSAPVAHWIRARSGGHTRLVHIGRPWMPTARFDLVITTPQYALPAAPNVLHNSLTLNRPSAADLAAAADAWEPRFSAIPRPWTAVLVGGNARPYLLDDESAKRLANEANRTAEQRGGSLLVSTSPRTDPRRVRTLRAGISVPCHFHGLESPRHTDNPYRGYLALADDFIVTGDSASMLSEACASGRPVWIFDLPERPDARIRLVRWLRATAPGKLFARLVDLGLISSTRDMTRFHRNLIERGLAAQLGDPAPDWRSPGEVDDLARAVERVRAVMTRPEPR